MLIILEVLAMESESIVGIYYGKQETFPCPPRVLSPLGLESIVPGVVPGVGIHVNQGPQMWCLTWCLENSLEGSHAAPPPHVGDVEPVQRVHHVLDRGVKVSLKQHPHRHIQLLLDSNLVPVRS